MSNPAIKFKTEFRAPPAVVRAQSCKPAPVEVREPVRQTERNRDQIAADHSVVLTSATDVASTLSHVFAIDDPQFIPTLGDFGDNSVDMLAPAERPRCIPLSTWAFVWPPMRTRALVMRTGELFFRGQPPVRAFRSACVEHWAWDTVRENHRPPTPTEQIAAKRAADIQRTRQLTLDALQRAAAGPDPDDPEHDRDRAGEARILAYKLPAYGVPAYWERGDRYPREDEVDAKAPPIKAKRLPSPITKLIRGRI